MTIFKTFWKILNKNKFTVIMYTVLLLLFGASNMQTSQNSMNFVASKPNVLIVNNDENEGITKDLIKYITDNSNIIDIAIDENMINDALFYRDINYCIYIPSNYRIDFLNGKNPQIEIKSTGDYKASFEEMILSRYINLSNIYRKSISDENELIDKINETLSQKIDTQIVSKISADSISKATFYYNFASYSILACLLLIISLILNSFNQSNIRKRIVISNTNYKKHNRILLLSNYCYSILLWLFYVVISFILLGDIMTTTYGLICILNAFIFTICCTTIAFFIGNLVSNKAVINGIVNVIALGSSFLCGAFVPLKILPDSVLKIARILPSYYYISTNENLNTINEFNFETLKPIIINMIIMLGFSVAFILLTNIIVKRKRKIG